MIDEQGGGDMQGTDTAISPGTVDEEPRGEEAREAPSGEEGGAAAISSESTEDSAEAEATPAAEAEANATGADPATAEEGGSTPRTGRPKPARTASLYRAMRSHRPVTGRVEAVIKGGYEVRVGKVRGFCPHSQIDLHRVDNPEIHVGRTLTFRVTQVRRGGDDVVLSRRAVLEDERREEAAAVRATLLEGAIMQGRIAGTAEFGAFVDLGAGVMGLVHVSELSHARVSRIDDVVREGDAVQVKILKIRDGGKKISLSMRQAAEDPWSRVAQQFAPGKTYPGTVRRMAAFGAFVELTPGVEALAPAAEFAPSRASWDEGLEIGQTRDWLVLSVDPEQRRISVVPPVEGFDLPAAEALQVGTSTHGRVQRVENFGVFVWLAPGRVGLMPLAWTGTPRGADIRRRFPIGESVDVDIREITEEGRRIRLALKGAETAPDPRPAQRQREPRRFERPPVQRPEPPPDTSSFGTSLGDKLRAALDRSAGRG